MITWRTMTTLLLIPAVGLLSTLAQSVQAAPNSKPNIILFMADDVGYECFGAYGSKQYKTPNLDRMAKRGVRFDHCYSQPLCTPSRIKIMTGLYNARNYSGFSILNRDQKTFGHYMKEAGYRTAVGGKWQLYGAEHYKKQFRGKGTLPKDAGFDRSCLWQVDRLGKRFWSPLLNIDGETKQFSAEKYGPDIVTNFLLDFMAEKSEKPFFVYYPMILVHSPFVPTPDSKDRASKNKQRNFEDMVAYMDKLIGRFVKKTEELGVADDTLIMFLGDNGTHRTLNSILSGRTIKGGKGATTDAGTRVPLICYWPKTIAAGKVSNDLVDCSDFLPTMLAAAGAKVPRKLDGHSFLAQLQGKQAKPREWIYIYYCPRPERSKSVRFVRDQRWKLYGDGRFYDVAADPLEKSVAATPDGSEAALAREKLEVALKTVPAKGKSLLKFAP